MFNDFKTTVLLCAVLVMATVIVVGALGITSLKAKNGTLSHDLLQSQVSVDALLSSNDNKDERIKTLERDHRIITELNTSHRKQVADLQSTLDHKLERANQLRTSNHEPTKTWANTDLPSDALQLLKQTNCQSGNKNDNGLCAATP
jgi:biopolymer transport protein ExbB/TolQ